jgi:hypothetical protein
MKGAKIKHIQNQSLTLDKIKFSSAIFSPKCEQKCHPLNCYLTKDIALKRKNTLMKTDKIQELMINLRTLIIVLIRNGFEFNLEKNYNKEELQKIENKNLLELLGVDKTAKASRLFNIIQIIKKENNILLSQLPSAIKKYLRLKAKNKQHDLKIEQINSLEESQIKLKANQEKY